MLSETEIRRSLGLSAIWSGLMISLALYLDWDVVDLGKCFYILIMLSTMHAALIATLFGIGKFFSDKSQPTDVNQNRSTRRVLGQEPLSKRFEVGIALMLAVWTLLFGLKGLTLIGTLIFDGFSIMIESWPARNENIWGPNLLLQTTSEYLSFTILLLLNLAWDACRRIRTVDKTIAFNVIQFELSGYLYLVVSLIAIIVIFPLILSQNARPCIHHLTGFGTCSWRQPLTQQV